jgi:hypothetical protein
MRGAARPLALLAWALLAIAGALATAPADDIDRPAPSLRTVAASGPVTLVNSRNGQAILTASDMAPGDWTTGSVWLRNDGRSSARLGLARSRIVDTPGLGGGRLGSRLRLSVYERGALRWAGGLASMRPVSLGTLRPRQTRSFRLIALFPNGGTPPGSFAGDNAFRSASTRVRFDWGAEQLAAGPRPRPTPTPDRRPPRLRLRIFRRQRIVKGGYLRVAASCDEPCRLVARAVGRAGGRKVRTRRRRRRLRPRRRVPLRLRFTRRSRARILRALRAGRRVRLTVRARARDRAGNLSRVKRRALVRARRR